MGSAIRFGLFLLCLITWTACQRSSRSVSHLRTSDGTQWEISTLQLHEKCYCLLREGGISDFADDRYLFLILNNDGKLLSKINCTSRFVNLGYFKLQIQNDSIVVENHENVPLYYDLHRQQWVPTKGMRIPGVEDADFIIDQYDRGEWGTRTIFHDKKSGKNYFSLCAGKAICRWGNSYVGTGDYYVNLIVDPTKMHECVDLDSILQENVSEYRYKPQGEEILYENFTRFNPYAPPVKHDDIRLKTSFAANNRLYHLFTINDTNYIGAIRGDRLKRMIRLQPGITFYDDAIVFNDIANNIQYLRFRKDENTFGYMELRGNRMQFHYLIHNQDSLRYLGKDGFAHVLRGLCDQKMVSLEKLNQLEQQTGGTYLQIDRLNINHNGYYDPKFKTVPVHTKCFAKVIDRFLTLESEYLFNTKKNKLEAAFLEWRDTRDYRVPKFYTNKFEYPGMRQELISKSEEIQKLISRELQISPVRVSEPNGYYTLTWKTKSNLKLTLYSSVDFRNNNSLRVLIEMPGN